MNEQQVPKEVSSRLNGWFITFWIFTICHYVIGIGGVFASTMVADNSTSPETTKIFGIISALCIAFIGFIQPDQKYRKFVIAWRILDEKVNLYKHGIITINELIEGMAIAEKTLDQIEREAGKQTAPVGNKSDPKKET